MAQLKFLPIAIQISVPLLFFTYLMVYRQLALPENKIPTPQVTQS